MFVKHKNEIIEVVTIKELYEMAVAKGFEDAAVGVCCYDEEAEFDYCENVKFNDIEFGGLYQYGNGEQDKVCPCIWLNNHEI